MLDNVLVLSPHQDDQTLGSFYPEYQTAKTVREMLREMKEQNGLKHYKRARGCNY